MAKLNRIDKEEEEYTPEKLIEFEDNIKDLFEKGIVKGPIHLSGTNEKALIKIFRRVDKKNDWVFSTWRNHYHWLLFGLSWQVLKQFILAGKSMTPSNSHKHFLTSAIVGGISPIAVGVALGLHLAGKPGHVWCFIGDAGYECGITKESIRYAQGHDLPITFVVEDNGKCVRADTQKAWGTSDSSKVEIYNYKRKYPHAGTGEYVMF
ncbi:MAG: thiamine pyrophosphate-dependent enzyme [Candidatus Aceula lacicola]|nr:thiamine pyrophosphate-dependent enzyme [Candidatus Aceula lacicola]